MAAAPQRLDVTMLSPFAWLITLRRVASVIAGGQAMGGRGPKWGSRALRDGRGTAAPVAPAGQRPAARPPDQRARQLQA